RPAGGRRNGPCGGRSLPGGRGGAAAREGRTGSKGPGRGRGGPGRGGGLGDPREAGGGGGPFAVYRAATPPPNPPRAALARGPWPTRPAGSREVFPPVCRSASSRRGAAGWLPRRTSPVPTVPTTASQPPHNRPRPSPSAGRLPTRPPATILLPSVFDRGCAPMHSPSVFRRLASAAVRGYLRHCPLRAGQWRLLRWASSFLVVELVPGAFIHVSDLSNAVELGILRHGLPEPADVRFFLSLLGPGMTVLDVGANIGEYTL